eukprot:g14537.t1
MVDGLDALPRCVSAQAAASPLIPTRGRVTSIKFIIFLPVTILQMDPPQLAAVRKEFCNFAAAFVDS